MSTPAPSVIYMSLIGLFVIITGGLHILFNTRKEIYYIYTGFKIFFLILFVLWMNKYFTGRFKKMLGMKDEKDDKEEDENFFKNLVDLFN